MKKILLFLVVVCLPVAAKKPVVLVSIPPLKYYVEALAGDSVDVVTLVPAGANPHSYEPKPRQMSAASRATVWFRVGEPFERQIAAALKKVKMVDVREGLDLLEAPKCCAHHKGGGDPHVWLSVRLGGQFAETMAEALAQVLPDQATEIENRLVVLKKSLSDLDAQLAKELAPCAGETVLVSHAAFGYFCRDYDLHQLAIEFAGKEPTPRAMTDMLAKARETNAKIVVLEQQFNNKGAQLVAKELELPTCMVNPLNEDIPATLKRLTRCICDQST